MPLAKTCILNGDKITVADAIRLRDAARHAGESNPQFECVECGDPVRPHRAGGIMSAHFEHLERNGKCSLSHVRRD